MSNYGMSNYIVRTMADGTAITANGVEGKSASYLITGNTVAVGDILQLFARVDRTVDAAVTFIVNIYINTSDSLAGASLLATSTTTGTAQDTMDLGRIFIVKSSTNTQGLSNAQSTQLRYVVPTGAFTETNINWTVDQYLIIALTNNGAGQTVLAKGMLVLKY